MTTSVDELQKQLAAARARIAELESRVARAVPLEEALLRLLAHELRSPLAPVLTAVQLLEEEASVPDDLRRWLAVIRRNVLVEAWMVDDAMDLLRIRSGTPPHPPEHAGIHAIIRSALDAAAGEMKHKNLEPKLSLDATQTDIRVHPPRLTHGLWNLIRSALKSTSGAAPLEIRTRDEAGAVVVEIVQPPGGGTYAAKIIDGVAGDDAALASQGAAGLAVLLARELVGSVGAKLTAGLADGSLTYAVRIPLERAATLPTAAAAVTPPPSRGSGRRTRVLLVDDHEDSLVMMGIVLERQGYDVLSARSVESALDVARKEACDILVSDLTLPDGSGMDLLRQLVASRPLPGIAVSGLGRSEDIAASRAAGFAEHLVKPILPEAVDAAIRRVLGQPA